MNHLVIIVLVVSTVLTLAAIVTHLTLVRSFTAKFSAAVQEHANNVASYRKSVIAHLDLTEATASDELKKIIADIRARP